MTQIQSTTLIRYISGEATSEEAEAIEAWINESALNRQEFQCQWKIIELTCPQNDYQLPDIETEWKKMEQQLQHLNNVASDASSWYKLFSFKLFIALTAVISGIFILKPFYKSTKFIETASSENVLLSDKKELQIARGKSAKINRSQKKIKHGSHANLNEFNGNVFDFNDVPLTEVVSNLEKEYEVSIRLENPDIGSCRITSRFEHKSLVEILDIMKLTLGFEYRYISETKCILITGDSCD